MSSYATGRLSTVEFFTDYKGLAQTVITLISICNDLLALHPSRSICYVSRSLVELSCLCPTAGQVKWLSC